MRTNRLFSAMTAAAMAGLLAASFTACSDHDDIVSPSQHTPQQYNYLAYVFGSSDNQRVTLDSIASELTTATSSASWLKVSVADGLDRFGQPAIDIESTAPASDNDEATITVTAKNGDLATVRVRHQAMGLGDAYNGGNGEWITEWYNFTTVPLQGFQYAQRAPWTIEGSDHIPEEVRLQVYPSQGWEMGFSYLNDNSLDGVRYFALYNKWSGQVRLYTYIDNPTGWGSDLMLNAQFGTANHNDMWPFYNMHEYGIPTCHSLTATSQNNKLLRNAKLVSSQSQTFQTWLTPFSSSSSLTPGWYCFEFDMSGYVPDGKDWLKPTENQPRIKLFAETANNQNVSLKGSLKGKLDGTFSDPEIIQHGGATATSGILSALGGGLTGISGMATNSIKGSVDYANLMTKLGGDEGIGGYLNPIKYWGGFACSIGGGLLSFIGSQMEEPITYDTIPGKIDLTLDATLELDGYIRAATGNSMRGLSVSPQGIYTANGANGHMGKGVWGLAEDPVVYIDKEDLLATASRVNLTISGGSYQAPGFDGCNVRMVYAFDPTSVKINLNKNLFRDIQDVTVTANVGVLPNNTYGHTDSYRQMLVLGDRPSFDISGGKTSGSVTLSGSTTPLITVLGLNDLADGGYETTGNCVMVAQKNNDGDEWQRYYGRLIEVPEVGKKIVVDPQVFVPYTHDGEQTTKVGNPTAPDFVVRVDVQFTALDDNGERKGFQFGKLFIPVIKVVDYKQMSTVANNLRDYATKCEKNQPVGKLANDSSIPVRHPAGHRLIEKTIKLLEKLDM